jgi:hypothetical protein
MTAPEVDAKRRENHKNQFIAPTEVLPFTF